MKAVDAWRESVAALAFKISLRIKNDYISSGILFVACGEGKPYPWKKIHRHWLVFQRVPRSPSKIAEKILKEN